MTHVPAVGIEKLTEAKKFGMVDAFAWPASAPLFARTNVIYGRNGSGKTTFSNAFRVASQDENLGEIRKELCSKTGCTVVFQLRGKSRGYEDLVKEIPIFVFNGGFIADHVYEGSKARVTRFAGGGSLGEISNPEIKSLHAEASEDRKKLEAAEAKVKAGEGAFEKIKSRWSKEFNKNPAMSGQRLIGVKMPSVRPKGDLPTLRRALDGLYKRKESLSDPRRLQAQLEVVNQCKLPTLLQGSGSSLGTALSAPAPQMTVGQIEDTVQRMASVELAGSKGFREWLEDGVTILRHSHEKGTDSCPLCHSDVSSTVARLLGEYEAYVKNERTEFRKEVGDRAASVEALVTDLRGLAAGLPAIALILKDHGLHLPGAISDGAEISGLADLLDTLRTGLADKANNLDKVEWECLSRVAEVDVLIETLADPLGALGETLASAKTELEKLKSGDTDCVSKIRATINDMAGIEFDDAASGQQIKAFMDAQEVVGLVSRSLPQKEEKLRTLVAQLKLEARSVNRYLKQLGLHHFEIDIADKDSGTGNVLINFGSSGQVDSIKNSLSEGEKTCLAFSYFLSKMDNQLLGDQSLTARAVVVIDDPVSSLDEERLHATAQIIARKFEKAGQLFVLSHNMQYLRFQSSALPKKDRADFYLQKSEGTLSVRCLPKALANYATPYYEKLATVMEYANAVTAGTAPYEEGRKHLPGCVRIVLETFLGFKFCVLQQGASDKKFLTPGLDKLTSMLSGRMHEFKANKAVGNVSHTTVLTVLEEIKRLTDSQLHGNIQAMEVFVFVSETELAKLCQDALDVLRFFDPFHASTAEAVCAA